MRLDFAAQVTEHGMLLPDDPAAFRVGVSRFKGQRVVISVESLKVVRSLRANSRYWTVIVPVVRALVNVGRDWPLSKDQVHDLLKRSFIGTEDTPLGPVAKHSKDLDDLHFAQFCDDIEAHFSSEFAIQFPGPGESLEVSL